MSNNTQKEATKELEANKLNRTLYELISEPRREPIYIYDDAETNEKLKAKYAFSIDTIYTALRAENNNFALPIQSKATPVIILTKENTQKVKTIASILKHAGVSVFYQDANKPFLAIQSGEEMTIKKELARQYRENFSAGGTIADFKNIITSNANTPAIKTGFPVLDKVLDGGLYEGLYAIGAISSLGKTTFCLNIAEQIAQSGQDVIIIALEMSKYQLIGRSISRLIFKRYKSAPDAMPYEYCKTSRGITDGSRYIFYDDAEREIINDAIDFYSNNIGGHLFIYEAIGSLTAAKIRTIVNNHMAYTGARPVLIVDYLQLIQSEDKYINGNDKIRTDFNLTELKQLSRDYKLPIIAISSFNRASYNTEVKLECFKESGGIDYTCDVILGLQLAGVGGAQFDVTEAKAKNPREIELVFLKNREAAVGEMIKYYYFPMFNHFEETEEDIRAEREYQKQAARDRKEAEKASQAEQAKAERAQLVADAYNAAAENGSALITEMVDFCGGKPTYKTLLRYIRETGDYTIYGNKVIKNAL